MDEVRYFTEDLITGYATGVGWSEVSVDYHDASNYDATQTDMLNPNNGTIIFGCILLTALALVGFGTLLEMTTVGDSEEMKRTENKDALYEAAKFRRNIQYDAILLQRKETWAQSMLCFSQLRNAIQMNSQSRTYRDALKIEAEEDIPQPEKRIIKNLKVFNGLKGASAILVIWGITFYFSWFAVISNQNDVDTMKDTMFFNIVSGTVYTVPVFFFCSGFL
jgi:hypothetical protein